MQPLHFLLPFQRSVPQINLCFLFVCISIAYKLISHQQTKPYDHSWSLENSLWWRGLWQQLALLCPSPYAGFGIKLLTAVFAETWTFFTKPFLTHIMIFANDCHVFASPVVSIAVFLTCCSEFITCTELMS